MSVMSHIQKIIRYFFHHPASSEMVDRVHKRLVLLPDEAEKDEALHAVWDQAEYPDVSEKQKQLAFSRLEQQFNREDPKPSSALHMPRWIWMAAVGITSLLSLPVSYYLLKEARMIENKIAAVSFIEHYVPIGKREQLLLPDSTSVWLNSGSLLIYPSSFVGSKREVYLAGEGYFSVTKNKECPFVVKSHALDIQVLGTRFNLSAYPDAEKMVATLEQGSIHVQLKNGSDPYLLTPEEQLIYKPHSGEVKRCQVIVADYYDWIEGGLYFNSASLKDVFSSLERTYNITIHLQTSSYQNNRLTIHFIKNESLETIMLLIKEMIPGFQYEIEGKNIYIR